MKKLFAISLTVAALAAVSCQKEQDFKKNEGVIRADGIEVTVIADQRDSKTAMVDGTPAHVKWLENDAIKLFEVLDDGSTVVMAGTQSTTTTLSDGDTKAAFKVTLTETPSSTASYRYSAVYPASAVSIGGTSNKFVRLTMPSTQHLIGNNLSADSDILISDVFDNGASRVTADQNLNFSFRRVGTVVKLTLVGITADERIKSVTIDAPQIIAGRVKYDPATSSIVPESFNYDKGNISTITLQVDDVVATGTDVLWFRVLSETQWSEGEQFGITVETDKAYYRRDGTDGDHSKITLGTGKTVKFIDGGLTMFGVGLSGYRVAKSDYSGDYLILARKGASEPYEYFALKGEANGNRLAQQAYDGSLVSYNGDAALVWTVAASGSSYTIKNRGNFVGWTSSNTADLIEEANYDADACLMSIADNGDGTFKITNTKTPARYLAKNTSSDWFAFYENAGQIGNIVLVPATALETVATPTFSPVAGEVDADTEVTISTTTPGATIYYTVDGSDPTTSSTQGTSVIIDAAKTVKAFAVKDGMADSEIATAIYTITGVVNYPTLETSNVTLTAGTNGSTATVNEKEAIKVGASSKGGDMTITVPAGTTKLHLHAAAWKGVTGLSLNITGATVSPDSIELTADEGITGNSPFTLSGNPEDFYFVLDLSDITSDTEITLASSSAKRFVVWGVNAVAAVDNRAEAGMSWSAASASASIADGDVVTFTPPTLTPGNATGITYNSTDTDVATINDAGVVTIIAGGTTTIEAIFAGDANYKPATVGYTLTVTDNRTPVVNYDFEDIAALNALVTSTSSTYNGYLTDAVVSFVPAANVAIIKDATGSIMYFKSGHGLVQGQTFTGAITVTAVKYNSLYSEITSIGTAAFAGSETPVAPEIVQLSDLIGNYDEYQNAYVQIAGLTVTSVSSKNINVTDGNNSYVVYDNTGSATCGAGDVITAVGTITKYQTTEELKVWNSDDITVTGTAPKTITFSQPVSGGTFTVTAGGSPITSGDTVASGTVVTLTATPSDGYTFGSWTVSGATVADANSATTTFTMGSSSVTVSASFNSSGSSVVTLKYSGSTTINMTGDNDAATLGLSASDWSVIGAKGSSANLPGLNKDGTIRLYYNADGSNTITVSSLSGATINSITITYNGTYSNGKVLVGGNVVAGNNGTYSINSDSFIITNGNTSNVQVRIEQIEINYTANN